MQQANAQAVHQNAFMAHLPAQITHHAAVPVQQMTAQNTFSLWQGNPFLEARQQQLVYGSNVTTTLAGNVTQQLASLVTSESGAATTVNSSPVLVATPVNATVTTSQAEQDVQRQQIVTKIEPEMAILEDQKPLVAHMLLDQNTEEEELEEEDDDEEDEDEGNEEENSSAKTVEPNLVVLEATPKRARGKGGTARKKAAAKSSEEKNTPKKRQKKSETDKDQLSVEEKESPELSKLKKKKRKLEDWRAEGIDPSKLEESVEQVNTRFLKGCECIDDNCFKGLNAEMVFKHRLNIAELTKAEHDMYMMGLQMACISNPCETLRHKERKYQRCTYQYQGKRVCLDAFLYLENTTHFKMKRIRKHLMTHGVCPRIHGNHGRKPHNTFPLDIYQHTTAFLQSHIQRNFAQYQSPARTKKGKPAPIYLPQEISRKKIWSAYKEYCDHFEPHIKVMGYSTFRHFMKKQFPHLKFHKVEFGKPVCNDDDRRSDMMKHLRGGKGLRDTRPNTNRPKDRALAQPAHQNIDLSTATVRHVPEAPTTIQAAIPIIVSACPQGQPMPASSGVPVQTQANSVPIYTYTMADNTMIPLAFQLQPAAQQGYTACAGNAQAAAIPQAITLQQRPADANTSVANAQGQASMWTV